MSVVVQQDDEYFVFTKGSDSVLLPRINFGFESDPDFKNNVENHIMGFAKQGLRVLVIAGKKLENLDYLDLKK